MMRESVFLDEVCLGYPITAEAHFAGGDLSVTILGGCSPHIGSVSFAVWESGNSICKNIVRPGHRDDVVSERFARQLSEEFSCTVSACCGIHYEALTPQGLKQVLAATHRLLERLIDTLKKPDLRP